MNNLPQNFCVFPWVGISNKPNGNIRPCCKIHDNISKDDNSSEVYRLDNCDIIDYWNSSYNKKLRQQFLNNEQPTMCAECFNVEKHGIVSFRQKTTKQYLNLYHDQIMDRVEYSKEHDYSLDRLPLYIDLKGGNLCNLKCRDCFPGNSTQFLKNMNEVDNIPHLNDGILYVNKTIGWENNERFFDNLIEMSSSAIRVKATGGEPTINEPYLKFLDYYIKQGRAKDIYLHIITNATNVNDEFLKRAREFRYNGFTVSVDGVGALQEFTRYPINWVKFEQNVATLAEYVIDHESCLSFSPTYYIYNILNIVDITKWILNVARKYNLSDKKYNISYNLLHEPRYFSIKILPDEIKEEAKRRIMDYVFGDDIPEIIKNELTGIASYISEQIYSVDQQRDEFMRVNKIYNKERNQDNSALDPMLQKWIADYE